MILIIKIFSPAPFKIAPEAVEGSHHPLNRLQ